MLADRRFDRLTDSLQQACRLRNGVVGLVLLGSAAAAERRDEWSDHDFFVIIEPGSEEVNRAGIDWLPAADRIAGAAREGALGLSVLYDDGHVLEFAVATPAELESVLVNDSRVVYDEGTIGPLVEAWRSRSAELDGLARPTATDTANDTALMLVKILIGVGRARRGELLAGGQMVRTWATNHLIRAIRGRIPADTPRRRDTIDPVRRLEFDYPDLGARIAGILESPVEAAGLALYRLARQVLEPGWDLFPSRAADAVARRLGWSAEQQRGNRA